MAIKQFLRKHGTTFMVGVGGVLVGTIISGVAIASAAVPDAGGTIHGCRNNLLGLLRVVDSASQSCNSSETSLNWDQNGVKGYARINGTSLDTAHSRNISNFTTTTFQNDDIAYAYTCLTVNTPPGAVDLVRGTDGGTLAFKDASGTWVEGGPALYDHCPSGTNIIIREADFPQSPPSPYSGTVLVY